MFQDSFIRTQENLAVKAWVFPLSFATHAILAAILIVIPLLNTADLPTIEITSAFLAPPPPPPAKKAATTQAKRIKPVQNQSSFEAGKLVAPAASSSR